MDKELEHIVKDTTLISCDYEECEYRGEMFYCYLGQEKKCTIYLEYIARERQDINEQFKKG